MNVPEDMQRAIWQQIERARAAANNAADLLNDPKGKRVESLEDALNELQDAGYHARGAFNAGRVYENATGGDAWTNPQGSGWRGD